MPQSLADDDPVGSILRVADPRRILPSKSDSQACHWTLDIVLAQQVGELKSVRPSVAKWPVRKIPSAAVSASIR
jgi:hypothetical protein